MDKKDEAETFAITFQPAPSGGPDGRYHTPIFPQIGVGWDVEVPYLHTLVTDKWLRDHSMTLESIKALIASLLLLPVTEWNIERDLPCRAHEVVAYLRVFNFDSSEVRVDA